MKSLKEMWEKSSKLSKLICVIALIVLVGAIVTIIDNNGRLEDITNPNHAPEIVYAYPGMPTITSQIDSAYIASDTKLLQLKAGIIDRDGDKLTVTFWIKSSSMPWKGVALFEGYNNTYVHNLNPAYFITYLSSNKYEWRVDVTDGRDSASKTFQMYVI
jgi:hypothetical protein